MAIYFQILLQEKTLSIMSSQEYLQGLMRGETDDVALKFKLLTFDVYRADVYRA